MPAPTTSEELLDLVRKSGIVEDKRLDPYIAKLRAEGRLSVKPGLLAGILIKDGLLTHFQAEQLVLGKWRRFTIGKYKVLERLGQGGMGSVYLCEHKLMRRRVAVKVLPTAKASAPEDLERFYREARAVAALDHPNIVHAYDIDQDEALHFLVMEYVDGISLQDLVKRSGPLDPVRAAHYISQTAQGLAHAHLAGLVHRDIKPGNLLVDRTGVLKILDMGLARFFNDEEDVLTRKYDQNVLGTADYLSPEQVEDSHEVDTRADIYSLGATFYYLLTGKTLFEEGTVAQKLMWHRTRKPKPISSYRQDVPAELVAVMDRMMEKRPEDRFQHPQEVSEALQPWTQQPIAPPTEDEIPRLSLAAVGARPGESSPNSTGPKASGSSARRQWQISTPSTSATPAPRPSGPAAKPPAQETRPPGPPATVSGPPPNTVKQDKPATAPLLPTLPARNPANGPTGTPATPATEPSPWDALDDGGAGTAAAQPSTIRPRSNRTSAKDKSRKLLWLWLGLVVAAVLIGLVILLILLLTSPTPTPARPPLRVGRAVTGPFSYQSIQQALKAAQPDDVIELWDERHEENVIVDPVKGTTAVTLRAAPDKKVVWTYRKGADGRPLLQLTKARDFRLQGDRMVLDGRGQSPTLILATLHCPGLTVTGAQCRGYTRQAIHLSNCTGTAAAPVRFEKLSFARPAAPEPKAFFFDVSQSQTLPPNNYIDVLNCEFGDLLPRQILDRKDRNATGANVQLPAGLSW